MKKCFFQFLIRIFAVTMSVSKIINRFFQKFLDRRRISMTNVKDGSEYWHILVSPAGILAALTALVLIIFAAGLAIVAYTPVVEYIPGFKTDAMRSRDALIDNIMRIDSLERILNSELAYNENIVLVMEGSTPAVRTTIATDSVYREKELVSPSAEELQLRKQLESSGLVQDGTAVTVRENSGMTAPVAGIIITQYDSQAGSSGIRMATDPLAQVVSVSDGTVMDALWTPDKGYTIEIQHGNGFVSRYRNLNKTLVSQGQVVRSNEVIGYTAAEPAQDGSNMFEFELWSSGRSINPESYIRFYLEQ